MKKNGILIFVILLTAVAALEKAIETNPSYYTKAQKNLDKVKAALKKTADGRIQHE